MKDLKEHLIAVALDRAASPADAVTAMVTGGAAILSQHFGEAGAISLMRAMLDQAASEWVGERTEGRRVN